MFKLIIICIDLVKQNVLILYKMSLEIITGNMFSGKTSELIRRLKRYRLLYDRVVVVNSVKDTRNNHDVLHTHDGVTFECIKVDHLSACLLSEEFCDSDVVAIDEAQFFSNLKILWACVYFSKRRFYWRVLMQTINKKSLEKS